MSLLDTQVPAVRDDTPPQFVTLTIVAIVLTGLSVLWSGVDTRTVEGVAVWMKPLKFGLSFSVLFATIALVEARLSGQARKGWTLQIVTWIMAAAFLSEMAYMMYQAGRAEASHFNFATPFNEFMYTVVMFGGAVALVAGTGVIGWIAQRDKDADLSPAMREAIWLGFLLTFILTMIVANYLGATGRFVGVHPEGAPTLPLVGWSGVTGDLRPAHFASLHAMQALPLVALWMTRGGKTGSVRTIRFAALGYSATTMAVFAQALMGLPLIPLG